MLGIYYIDGQAAEARHYPVVVVSLSDRWRRGRQPPTASAIAAEPGYAAPYLARGIAYTESVSRQFDPAIADFSMVISLYPQSVAAYARRGRAYGVKAATHGKRGSANFAFGNFELAIADYSKAIEIARPNADFYFDRGAAYKEVGRRDDAIADYRKALALGPTRGLETRIIRDALGASARRREVPRVAGSRWRASMTIAESSRSLLVVLALGAAGSSAASACPADPFAAFRADFNQANAAWAWTATMSMWPMASWCSSPISTAAGACRSRRSSWPQEPIAQKSSRRWVPMTPTQRFLLWMNDAANLLTATVAPDGTFQIRHKKENVWKTLLAVHASIPPAHGRGAFRAFAHYAPHAQDAATSG